MHRFQKKRAPFCFLISSRYQYLLQGMNDPVTMVGTDPNMTSDEIVAETLRKLKEARIRYKGDNHNYLDRHPELRDILDDFMSAALSKKPEDVVEFGWTFFTDLRNLKLIGDVPLLMITGPDCVGKSTIMKLLASYYPTMMAIPPLHTSRPPKEGETNGKEYMFENVAIMEQAIERGELLFHYGDDKKDGIYGLSFNAIDSVRSQGKICLVEVPAQQAMLLRSADKLPMLFYFLKPPTPKEHEHRIAKRDFGKRLSYDDEDAIHKRVLACVDVIKHGTTDGAFDLVVDTKTETHAVRDIMTDVQARFPLLKFSGDGGNS